MNGARARGRGNRARSNARLARDARRILEAGQRAADPGRLVRRALGVSGKRVRAGATVLEPGRVFVVAAGKAAHGMAAAARTLLGRRWTRGIVISNVPSPVASKGGRTTFFTAGHPIPDERGVRAGRAVIRLLRQAREGDLVLLLLSGGASALLPAPRRGVSLAEKRRITSALLVNGATIHEINAVRARLSELKGGGFARIASPARVVTLALSDVPGDDPAVIGSGPAVIDGARAGVSVEGVVRRRLGGMPLSPAARRYLTQPSPAAPPSLAPAFHLVGSGKTFLEGAARAARGLGYRVRTMPGGLAGEARRMGRTIVRTFAQGAPGRRRAHLWSGETVVTVRGHGIGGRNLEVALAAVPLLERAPAPVVLATRATDGVDGPADAAGAIVDSETAGRLRRSGLSPRAALAENDSFPALRAVGVTQVTGPSGTNVGDVALILG